MNGHGLLLIKEENSMKKWIAIVCMACMIIGCVTYTNMEVDATVDERGNNTYMHGRMMFDYKLCPENAVLFDGKAAYFSLRAFFESAGAEVIYDGETDSVQIKYLNDVLVCTLKNGPTVPEGFEELHIERTNCPISYLMGKDNNVFQLNPMSGTGACTRINDRIYLISQTFEYMLDCLGYVVKIDPEAQEVHIYSKTLNNYLDMRNEGVNASLATVTTDELARVRPLADGSYVMEVVDRNDNYRIIETLLIDANGRRFVLQQEATEQ